MTRINGKEHRGRIGDEMTVLVGRNAGVSRGTI